MVRQLHPNTKTAWTLIFSTLLVVATLVIVLNLSQTRQLDPIVYSSNDGTGMEIYTMDADGSNVRQLTDNNADD